MMDITRNQILAAGLVLVFVGLQFRLVDSFVLTPQFTHFLAERTGHPVAAVSNTAQALVPAAEPVVKKTVKPPDWLGWSLLSVGAVLVLHSAGMRKPE